MQIHGKYGGFPLGFGKNHGDQLQLFRPSAIMKAYLDPGGGARGRDHCSRVRQGRHRKNVPVRGAQLRLGPAGPERAVRGHGRGAAEPGHCPGHGGGTGPGLFGGKRGPAPAGASRPPSPVRESVAVHRPGPAGSGGAGRGPLCRAYGPGQAGIRLCIPGRPGGAGRGLPPVRPGKQPGAAGLRLGPRLPAGRCPDHGGSGAHGPDSMQPHREPAERKAHRQDAPDGGRRHGRGGTAPDGRGAGGSERTSGRRFRHASAALRQAGGLRRLPPHCPAAPGGPGPHSEPQQHGGVRENSV